MQITREEGQQAVESLYALRRYLLVEYCTGFGKGKASLNAVAKTIKRFNLPKGNGLIIVHNVPARERTWPKEIEEWQADLFDISDVEIKCYASLKNITGKTYQWVIADECHYITPSNAPFFEKNRIESLILMTGVLPDASEKIAILKKLSQRNKITITLDEAVDSGVLNDYRIVVWQVPMTPTEESQYLQLCRKVDRAQASGNEFFNRNARGERANFIYNLESKYKATCYIRDQIRQANRRMVIFASNVAMADRLSPYRIHGQSGAFDYNRFLNMEINEVSSVKMIQEGANIKRLETGLIHQVNSKQLNLLQKLGRLMRLEVGEIARMHVMVAKDTYDQTWAANSLINVNKSKVIWKDLDPALFSQYS